MKNNPEIPEGCEDEMQAKYINPFTDFGFKKLFGEEGSKDLLIDFLNSLLPLKNEVVDLSFTNKEKLGELPYNRSAIYDIYCIDKEGKHFIVEMQNVKQLYFKDRTIFYSTFPVREQAEKGNWNFQLQPIYCVSLLGFEFDDEEEDSGYLHQVELKDQYNQVFYEKLKYIFVELPKFTKEEYELETKIEKWLYFLKNLDDFEKIPDILNEEVFKKAFVVAEIANFNERELATYEESLKIFRDNINTLRYAVNEGKEEGKELGRKQGIKEGRKEGRREGRREALKETVTIQLCKKFKLDSLPDILEQKLGKAEMNLLQEIRDNIFEFDSLDEVKSILR